MTTPVDIERVIVTPTSEGFDIGFILQDVEGNPTILLMGKGMLLIEDFDPDSAIDLEDSTGALFRKTLNFSRNDFEREEYWTGARERVTDICQLGIFPYDRFDRQPTHKRGRVRIAVIWPVGPLIGTAEVTFPDSIVQLGIQHVSDADTVRQ